MAATPLIHETPRGIYCPPGDFYIDPWQPVERAIITHAHSDHARRGHAHYLATTDGLHVLRARMGDEAVIDTLEYGASLVHRGVQISLHPAGHVLGSAQIRLEYEGQVTVVAGDYKDAAEPSCRPFEVVPCHTFVTESTFGLPIYRWPDQAVVAEQINAWWRQNRDEGRASVLFAYALGKAQRVLMLLDPSIGPIYCHGAVERLNREYRLTGIALPPTAYAGDASSKKSWAGAMVVAPPSALGSVWLRKFGDAATGYVSGWMQVRGHRRRRSVDRGFVLSDHADWPGLQATIQATGAERILVTHGSIGPMVRWLRETGRDAHPMRTQFEGERDDSDVATPTAPDAGEEGGTE